MYLNKYGMGAVLITSLIFSTAFASNLNQFISTSTTSSSSVPTMISAESGTTYTIATGSAYCRSLNAACQYKADGSACTATTYTGWRMATAEDLGLFVGMTASSNLIWTRSVHYGNASTFVYYRLSDGYWYNVTYNSSSQVRCVR